MTDKRNGSVLTRNDNQGFPGLRVRPYQLLCVVCSLAENAPAACVEQAGDILVCVRKTPDIPITLLCNAGEVFAYQDPGTDGDTPEGVEFNMKRDLEILYRLNLMPGCTLPARIIFNRLFDTIEDTIEICCFQTATSPAWRGCLRAHCDAYVKGRARGIGAIIPSRDGGEMIVQKRESMAAVCKPGPKNVRPHILLCAVCQYGGGTRPPYPEDNLPELIELILKEPDTPITVVPHADWMMCAPCPNREPGLNACVANKGSGGLPNQMRDLRVLQKIGLTFGSTMKARDLFRLLFERIPGTFEMCHIKHAKPSVWWTGCGSAVADSENFAKGKKLLVDKLGL